MSLWLVTRTLDRLLATPRTIPCGGHADAGLVPWAMVEYVRFACTQPTMPTLDRKYGGERLVGGCGFVDVLRAVEWDRPVICLLSVNADRAPEEGAIAFSAKAAGAVGGDARMISFDHPLNAGQLRSLTKAAGVEPQRVSRRSYGWSAAEAAQLGDFLTWVNRLRDFAQSGIPIAAINGRLPAWHRDSPGP